ncbi:MAG TPA: hypothetical protein VK988_03965 [Acidimicrobiales bacterium]|nr:hypothetical protein [Acidimicrobiales bacterium]
MTKTTGPGLLSAAILVDGEEVARQTTTPASDSATVGLHLPADGGGRPPEPGARWR